MLKRKFYTAIVRRSMVNGSEFRTVVRKVWKELRISVAKTRMFSWMSIITREDKTNNEYIRGSTEVTSTVDKMQENRLGRLGHVLGGEKTKALRLVKKMYGEGNRGRLMKKSW